MTEKPERHFDQVWYVSMANVVALTLMVILGAPEAYTTHVSLWAFGWFLSAEIAAGGVEAGKSGTKTSWLFWHVKSDPLRVGIGVWMGILMFFAFPAHWFFYAIAVGFFLWLPAHYTRPGAVGPVDMVARWLGNKLGVRK